MTAFEEAFWEQKGYEELKKYCRQGNEFAKEVAGVLHERYKIEQSYGESLSKLAAKAQKISKDTLGTLKSAWMSLLQEMESEAEIHRTLGHQLNEECTKQIKSFAEGQSKNRKSSMVGSPAFPVGVDTVSRMLMGTSDKLLGHSSPLARNSSNQTSFQVESIVEKAHKTFIDKLNDASKAKRNSHSKSKEAENLIEQLEEAKAGRGKQLSEKDVAKLESRSKKATENAFKADKEYMILYQNAERTRLSWETAMYKYCQTCEKLEEERVQHLKDMFSLYGNLLAAIVPQLQQNFENIKTEAFKIIPLEDVATVAKTRGSPRQPSEQVLYCCYEQDLDNSMDEQRRREGLEAKIESLKSELRREEKTKAGVMTLYEAYGENPDYCSEAGHEDVAAQLTEANALIDSLNASMYNLEFALAQLCGHGQTTHSLMNFIETTRDKQGVMHSCLRVPFGQANRVFSQFYEEQNNYDNDDEFDDDQPGQQTVLCRCRSLYEYNATQSDELSIKPGDIINVTAKLDGGWWQGELNNRTGIFPENYVQEVG